MLSLPMPTYHESPLWVFFTTLCNFLRAHRNTDSHITAAPLQLHSSTRLPKESLDSTTKAVVSKLTTWQHRLNFQLTNMKVKAWALHPWANLSKASTEINKTFMNWRLSAVNLPGNPSQQLIILKLTHCAAQEFSLAFQKWTDCSSLAPINVSRPLQNFYLETPF